jgi:hypothetical protein
MELGREMGGRRQNSRKDSEERIKKRVEEVKWKDKRLCRIIITNTITKTIIITSTNKHSSAVQCSVPDVSQSCKLNIFGVITCTIKKKKKQTKESNNIVEQDDIRKTVHTIVRYWSVLTSWYPLFQYSALIKSINLLYTLQ